MTSRARLASRITTYKGVRMRSRLEATAAARLDEMGVEWAYEPECFADETGQYLPDFKLWPRGNAALTQSWWLEIKPANLWHGWPVEPRSELGDALERMEIIRSSDPTAALSLWIFDRDISGALLIHSPLWLRKTGWNFVPPRDYLARVPSFLDPAELYRAQTPRPTTHRGLLADDRRVDPWAEVPS